MAEPALHVLPRWPALPMESWADQLFTQVGKTVDGTLFRIMQQVIERALIPDPEQVEALRQSARPLLDPALQASPGRFFEFGSEPRQPLLVRNIARRKIEGGTAVTRRLTTEYQPYGLEPGARDVGADPILLEHWVHDSGRCRGTVVALHGFTMGRPRVDAFMLFARPLFQMGLDVVLMTLPHHGERTPPGSRFSGESFAVPHVARLSEAVREAAYEIGVVVEWLRGSSEAPVGLLGLSLGGYLTALVASLRDDLDFAIPMVPPACIGDLAWRFFEHTSHAKNGGPAALGHDELRRAFRVHSPLAHELRIERERVLIIAGRGDRIVPPSHPHALWTHWGEPGIHWFSGSHLAPFGRAAIVRRIERHLREVDVL